MENSVGTVATLASTLANTSMIITLNNQINSILFSFLIFFFFFFILATSKMKKHIKRNMNRISVSICLFSFYAHAHAHTPTEQLQTVQNIYTRHNMTRHNGM